MHTDKDKLPSLRLVAARPTGFDSAENFAGTLPDEGWGFLLSRTRDADTLTESNWRVALAELGGESEDVEVIRHGHWAVGWIECIGVREGTEAYQRAVEIRNALEDYPVLDDEDHSELEWGDALETWSNSFTTAERIRYIREHRSHFDVSSFAELLANARGTLFSGYASELLHG